MGAVDAGRFDAGTREENIASWVDACPRTKRARAALVALLPEQHPLYTGRSTSATARIRGYTLAAFERVGLPPDALPYILDELQNGDDAYLVAAAARALRGADGPADVGFATTFLETARQNVRYVDAPVTFEVYKPRYPLSGCTTATKEIDATVKWIGDADCCGVPAFPRRRRHTLALPHLQLENQQGKRLRFADFFSGKPAVVAFFYSRCDNVRKCSLTITKLAALQQELGRRGLAGRVRLSAITYDPLFDLPSRLETYGRDRGVQFGEDVCFFRVLDGFAELRDAFDLGVNYVGALVNRHRIELYVVDAHGHLAGSFTRFSWSDGQVADHLERLLQQSSLENPARTVLASAAAVALVLFPKCPLCFGAYASVLGVGALQLAPYRTWLLPVALLLLLMQLVTTARRASRTRRFASLVVSVAGAVAMTAGSVVSVMPALSLAGAMMMIIAAVLNVRAEFTRAIVSRVLPHLNPGARAVPGT